MGWQLQSSLVSLLICDCTPLAPVLLELFLEHLLVWSGPLIFNFPWAIHWGGRLIVMRQAILRHTWANLDGLPAMLRCVGSGRVHNSTNIPDAGLRLWTTVSGRPGGVGFIA